MYPEFAFSLFGSQVTVRAYGMFCILAALSALVLAPPMLRRAGLKMGKGLAFTLVLLAVFVIGARLLNVLVNPSAYKSPAEVFRPRFAGFSLYGGVLAAVSALLLLPAAFRYDRWAAADALTLPAGAAFCLARIGCFLNGCCAGKATQSALGIAFPRSEGEAALFGNLLGFFTTAPPRVWPTQLFEIGLALVGLAVILPIARRLKLAEGSAALIYAAWFSAARWAVLPFRNLPYSAAVTAVFYPALYGSVILVCAWLFYRRHRKESTGQSASRF